MVARDRLDESMDELLRHDHYDPEELARLLDMPIYTIRHAAFVGELKAYIVGHHIISLRREDIVRWLRERG
ncbi:MAG: DNA-binding protein [Thermomicrobiales bacterium]